MSGIEIREKEFVKRYPEELKRQTNFHHDFYDKSNPLKETRELCCSCHAEFHNLGKRKWEELKRLIGEIPKIDDIKPANDGIVWQKNNVNNLVEHINNCERKREELERIING